MSRGWLCTSLGGFDLEAQWDISPGQVSVLFGPSGSGKTLTIQSIIGIVKPYSGCIEIGGEIVFDHSNNIDVPIHHRRIGYVPQESLMFPHLNVLSNIGYGLSRWDRFTRDARVNELLEGTGLRGLEERYVWELSGGEQQRVVLARALAPSPNFLLLDEPFSALDVESRRDLRKEIRRILREISIPVLLITHDREDALSLGDHVSVIDEGKMIGNGDPVKLLGHPPKQRIARTLGVENILKLKVFEILASEGVMRCGVDKFVLEIPLYDAEIGSEITIGLRAEDVLIASIRPKGISARNIFSGHVISVELRNASYEVKISCGVTLVSLITKMAVKDLGISPGSKVWVLMKATSFFVLEG